MTGLTLPAARLRVAGRCDTGHPPVRRPTSLIPRLESIGLVLEQAVNASARMQIIPTALTQTTDDPDYCPAAAMIVRVWSLYLLCPGGCYWTRGSSPRRTY